MTKYTVNLKGLMWFTFLASLIYVLQGLGEYPLMGASKHLFLYGRAFCTITLLMMLVKLLITKKATQLDAFLIFMNVLLHVLFSQFFVPSYFIGYLQIILIFTMYFPFTRWIHNTILFSSLALMITAVTMSPAFYKNIGQFKSDAISSITVIALFCYFAYLYIVKSRIEKDILSEKFLEVGRNFGDLIHGLKGQFSSPLIYTEVLKREMLKETPDKDKIETVFKNLQTDLRALENQIKTINFISKNDNKIELVNIKEVIDSIIETFFKNKTNNVKVSYTGQENYYTNEYMIRSIAINALKNSLENFEIKKIENPEIDISLVNGKLAFKDNGGGFSPEALKKFKKSLFYTEKASGSGLGLFLIKGTIEGFGGKMIVENQDFGAVINIHLNKEPKV